MKIKNIRFAVPGGKVCNRRNGKEFQCTHIECSLSYSLGGVSAWDSQPYSRGYYASITPITVDGNCVSNMLGSGTMFLLSECNRKSHKREVEAIAEFDAEVKNYIALLYGIDGIDIQ